MRKKRNKMLVAFIVTVENLSSEQTALALADRIPVSENKNIKIDRVKITGGVKPDSRGLLHWKLTLKPKEKRQFRISYRVEYPSELVLETRRKRDLSRARKRRPRRRSNIQFAPDAVNAPAASPARPAPSQKYKIEEQLLDLEKNF